MVASGAALEEDELNRGDGLAIAMEGVQERAEGREAVVSEWDEREGERSEEVRVESDGGVG